jgi:Protein of unknown function (DUF4197)
MERIFMIKPIFSRRNSVLQFIACITAVFGISPSVWAQLSQIDATSGLRAALDQGAAKAVTSLGATNGFLNNTSVRIPLPNTLKKIRSGAKLLGMEKQFDELEVSMNRAAEAAVPKAKPLLANAIKQMTVQDAVGILKGGDDSVTKYFKGKTESKLVAEFLPFATQATEKVGLAQQYNAITSKGATLGLIKGEQVTMDKYIAQKAVDGLFFMIAQEERALRQNPLGASSDLLKRVFGALK